MPSTAVCSAVNTDGPKKKHTTQQETEVLCRGVKNSAKHALPVELSENFQGVVLLTWAGCLCDSLFVSFVNSHQAVSLKGSEEFELSPTCSFIPAEPTRERSFDRKSRPCCAELILASVLPLKSLHPLLLPACSGPLSYESESAGSLWCHRGHWCLFFLLFISWFFVFFNFQCIFLT